MQNRIFRTNAARTMVIFAAMAIVALSSGAAVAEKPDAKYPRLAKLRIPESLLPKGVTAVHLTLRPPHEDLKAFEITENKTDFGVNRMVMPLLMLNRIDAFYTATYHAPTRNGDQVLFGIHAWEYKDVESATSNVAEFAGGAGNMMSEVVSTAAEVRAALQSTKFLHDGTIVVNLTMDANAPRALRDEFEKLVRSRLSPKHLDVPIERGKMKGDDRPASGKPKAFDENGSELQQQVAGIRKKWQ